MAHTEQLVEWLNDAYAMEEALAQTLSKHLKDAEDYPEVYTKIEEHLEVTRQHAEMVKECIVELGEDTSLFKSMVGKMSGFVQGIMTKPGKDTIVKNSIAEYTAENLEIASYNAIITAARIAGEQRIVEICEEILEQEVEMAEWLRENLPVVVSEYIHGMQAQHGAA